MNKPWDFLDEYRGSVFTSQWPTLPEMFQISVKRYPDNRCFTVYDPDESMLTYTQAETKINDIARYLTEKGIKKGDKIALTGKNSPEWALSYLGILFCGAVVVPIDYQLTSDKVSHLIEYSDAKILFCDKEKWADFDAKSLDLLEKIALFPSEKPYVMDLKPQKEVTLEKAEAKDLAAILFTSGTTGNEKGVMLTHENLVSDCYLAQAHMQLYPTDVFYALLPIHHSYTMLAVFLESISVGAELVFAKKLAINKILSDLKTARVTMFLGIPMLFNKILKGILAGIRKKGLAVYLLLSAMMGISGFLKKVLGINVGKKWFKTVLEKASLASIRVCICGGGPLASSVFKKYNQLGINFVRGYGLTETSPIINLNPMDAYREASVGKVLPQTEEKVINPGPDGVGEIAVRGPMVMQGYYKNPKATEEVMLGDGWFNTEDLGYLDKDNYLYLTGRKKNMIVTEGGKNVYPEPIEDEFQLYDEVEQVLIRGYMADAVNKIEGIEAVIYPTEEHFKDAADGVVIDRLNEIVREVNGRLLPYQRISKVTRIKEAMEMSSTKKIKRHTVD